MLTEWNKFVQKVYREGKQKNANYKFKDALSDASARKGEMGKPSAEMGSVGMKPSKTRRSRKASRKSCMKKCKQMCKTQKMRGGKRRRGRKGGSHTLMPANFPEDSNAP
jgi:hypothetical protein